MAADGSVDNLALLHEEQADVGLALEDSLGAAPDAEPPPALARTYENYLQLLVPTDSPVRRVEDLAGRHVVLGAEGSGAAITGQVLLRAAGLARGDVRSTYASLAGGLAEVVEGTADAVVWSGGIPTPAVTDAARRRPLRMVALGRYATTMSEQSGFRYTARRVPPVGYGPVPGTGDTIGVANLLLARPGLPDEIAAAIVEVLVTRAARLVPDYVRGLQYLAPATMIQTGRVPLHPARWRRTAGSTGESWAGRPVAPGCGSVPDRSIALDG